MVQLIDNCHFQERKKMMSQIEGLQGSLKFFRQENVKAKIEIKSLTESLKSSEKALSSARILHESAYNLLLKEKDGSIETKEKQLGCYKKEKLVLEKQNKSLSSSLRKSANLVKTSKQNFEDYKKKYKVNVKGLSDQATVNASLQKTVELLVSEKIIVKKDLEFLQAENSKLKDSIAHSESGDKAEVKRKCNMFLSSVLQDKNKEALDITEKLNKLAQKFQKPLVREEESFVRKGDFDILLESLVMKSIGFQVSQSSV